MHAPFILLLLQAVGAVFFTIKVDLFYGQQNTTCTGEEENSVRDKINDALTSMNLTTSDGTTKVLNGDLCVDDKVHRNLVLINYFTWAGRGTCKLCSTGRRLRRLEQQSVAEEVAHLASLDLTNLITLTYVNDTGSCLYQAWATVVVVTVTETTQTLEDPCK